MGEEREGENREKGKEEGKIAMQEEGGAERGRGKEERKRERKEKRPPVRATPP